MLADNCLFYSVLLGMEVAGVPVPFWMPGSWSEDARARELCRWAQDKLELALQLDVPTFVRQDLQEFKRSLTGNTFVSEGVSSLLAHQLGINIYVITPGTEGSDALQVTRYPGRPLPLKVHKRSGCCLKAHKQSGCCLKAHKQSSYCLKAVTRVRSR